MSEFKFACPVCGQHITADSSASGGQIECPTCFQKIVVPQAPTSAETKFILSASQASKPRPAAIEAAVPPAGRQRSPARALLPTAGVVLVLLCAAGATLYVFRGKVFGSHIVWSLNLTNAPFPAATAVGSVHGSGFACERATLEGGNLSLRQGKGWPPDLGVTILLPFRAGEDFNGKTVEVAPDQPPPVPRVILRWKDDRQQAARQNINGGYALKVVFGQPANGRLPGRIYLCLPDEAKSFVAGTFEAELRKPRPGQPGPPKQKSRPPGTTG